MRQSPRPGENRSDRIGRGLLAPLVEPVMARHGAVGGLGLHRLSVRSDQHRGHQPQRTEALRHGVRLHVAVVVLAGPYETAAPLEGRSHHVVDQPVFVGQPERIHPLLVVRPINLLENILEPAVVLFENRVLRAQIEGPSLAQGHVETGMGESPDRGIGVVHAHGHPVAGEIVHLPAAGRPVLGSEGHRQRAPPSGHHVRRTVLVAESVTSDADRLRPARHQPRHVAADDRLAEDRAVQNVPDRPVGRLPHLPEAELLHAGLVGRDRGAFDPHVVLPDRLGRLDRHPVVRGVTVFDPEVIILNVDVQIGQNQLLLDEFPDHPRHLVPVQFHHGIGYLDLLHKSCPLCV